MTLSFHTLTVNRKRLNRRVREARLFADALINPYRPILAHLVPVRRCNLSCSYCNEYDRFSGPVPTQELLTRIDHLSDLGTKMVHLSGGEPMLHQDLPTLVRRIRRRKMISGLLTNGLLLSRRRIRELNHVGLDHLQISIDNIEPDEVSRKSLRILDQKLQDLAEHAEFDVNINTLLGSDLENPEDALVIAQRAVELGLTSTVGIIHDGNGQLKPFSANRRTVYRAIKALEKPVFRASSHNPFQENLIRGLPNSWHCPAGGRYLYVCEEGRVHHCSQQRGHPGIPLSEYTELDLKREFHREKPCAPFCTVSCVHRTSWLDQLRKNPWKALQQLYPSPDDEWTPAALPPPVRLLAKLFLSGNTGGKHSLLARVTLRVLGVR